MKKVDVAIIGGGPGGLTAAIYACRANLKTVFIEKEAPGGKMVKTFNIENWPGIQKITGPELSTNMWKHAEKEGAKMIFNNVTKIEIVNDQQQIIKFSDGEYLESKKTIIATGMIEKIPKKIIGIHEFNNKGVSYCAICDGPLYRGENVAVIGGGNSAFEESIYLSQIAKSVKVFVRKDHSRADQKVIDELSEKQNVEILYNSEILELTGEECLEGALVSINNNSQEIKIKALFPYIGQVPTNNFASHLDIFDDNGFIKTNEEMETSIKGLFAVGDIRAKSIRQIATAVNDGAIAGKVIANKLK